MINDQKNLLTFLQQTLTANQFTLTSKIQDQLIAYLELLIKWNKTYNLTSIRDPEEMITKHLVDSLSIGSHIIGKNILDVGTGGGLPGIPLALMQPERKFALLDSNRKKTIFLTHVVQALQIENVKIVCERVEKFNPGYCFDTIMTRAFATLKQFIELSQHLLCKDGCFLAMKGEYPQAEIAELGSEYSPIVYDLKINGLDAKRHLVLVKHNIHS
jgi:16S rRNA (guanine527-N7)-methyltransferase